MRFVVNELIDGVWTARGEAKTYQDAQVIVSRIKEDMLRRGVPPETIERVLEIKAHMAKPDARLVSSAHLPDSNPPKASPKELSTGKAPLIAIGSLLLLFFSSMAINQYDPKLAGWTFGVGVVIWFLAPVYLAFRGSSLRETLNALLGFLYIGCAVIVVAVLSSLILPSSCTRSIDTRDDFEWARKP